MIKYKLTTQDLKTHNNYQWEIGRKEVTSGEGELCSDGWLHCYHHPVLAIIMNPNHANINNPKLFEVECGGSYKDDRGLKCGFTEMTLIKEIELPTLTITQKVAFSILISRLYYKEESYINWGNNWLNNTDRTDASAYAAYTTYTGNAVYTANAAAYAAAYAAYIAYIAANASEIFLQQLIECAEKCLEY